MHLAVAIKLERERLHLFESGAKELPLKVVRGLSDLGTRWPEQICS
jgi:hypothetical protein